MKIKIIFVFSLITLFISCSTPAKYLKTSYNENNNEGMIVGTICLEKKSFNGYTFVYTDAVTAVADYANMSDNFSYKNSSGDFKEKRKTYYLFSIVKPAGNYKFAKIQFFDNTRHKQVKWEVPLNMNFTIEKGKTTYFGQLTVNTKKKIYTIENKLDRDKIWFLKKAPKIQF